MVMFRNVMMPGLTLPNVMQFVCTHLTPELTRARHEWQLHPNGATAIDAIVIATDESAHQRTEAAKLHDDQLTNSRVEILDRREIQGRFGDAVAKPGNGIVGLTIRVNEPDATSAMLEMAKVPHRETRSSVVVPASAAHGVVFEFAED